MSALDPLNGVVAWVIMRLHSALGHLFGPDTGLAWFLSIALLVILIRICLIPLFVKQVHARRKIAQRRPTCRNCARSTRATSSVSTKRR